MNLNHLGERTYSTRAGWKAAIRKAYPQAQFHSHEGTAYAFMTVDGKEYYLGDWDDTTGTVYASRIASPLVFINSSL